MWESIRWKKQKTQPNWMNVVRPAVKYYQNYFQRHRSLETRQNQGETQKTQHSPVAQCGGRWRYWAAPRNSLTSLEMEVGKVSGQTDRLCLWEWLPLVYATSLMGWLTGHLKLLEVNQNLRISICVCGLSVYILCMVFLKGGKGLIARLSLTI